MLAEENADENADGSQLYEHQAKRQQCNKHRLITGNISKKHIYANERGSYRKAQHGNSRQKEEQSRSFLLINIAMVIVQHNIIVNCLDPAKAVIPGRIRYCNAACIKNDLRGIDMRRVYANARNNEQV